MSAQDQMRAMLDELMGTRRNGEATEEVPFYDIRVCKSFLINTCPHDILAGTRMDIGSCPRIHKLGLRADYDMASKKHDYFYDIDTMEHLQAFISDCDRKTEIAKRKLAETQEELDEENVDKTKIANEISDKIAKKLNEVEMLGAKGDVEGSMQILEELETLRKERLDAQLELRNSLPSSSYQQQKLRVCEVCSAYLGVQDNEKRLADHFGGKLHLGFIKIRERLEELKKNSSERKVLRDLQRANNRRERTRSRSKSPASATKHKHKHHKHKHHHHHHHKNKKITPSRKSRS